jgi:hypothetical protein
MEIAQNTGNVGRMMYLIDEHGSTIEKMYAAIIDGDVDRVQELEQLGIVITDDCYLKAAILHDQLEVFSIRSLKVPT